jgi:hypothetical protein
MFHARGAVLAAEAAHTGGKARSNFVEMEREVEVEDEYRPLILQELQQRVEGLAESGRGQPPVCGQCRRVMICQDVRPVKVAHASD